jgi:hypothetical protein
VTNGRGVLLLVNRVTPAIKGYLRELGFEVDGTVSNPKGQEEKFQFVFSNHPIFHPFLSSDFGNLMDIRVAKYSRLRATEAMPLVFSERGAALFFQSAKQPGKLFVSAFGLDREHSSWPVHQTFIPFLDLALQAARPEDPTPTSFEPGEIARIQLAPGTAVREVVLRDSQRELARAPVELGKAQLRLPDKPGLYAVSYDDRPQSEKLLSVNPTPRESDLTFVDSPETFKTWVAARTPDSPTPDAPAAQAWVSLAAILQQQLWWWMVLAGLLALLLEMLIAESRKERV